MNLLYFAWVRQKIGKGEEMLNLPAGDVASLIAHLKSLGSGYEDAFADLSRIRIAVNQRHAGLDAPVGPNDEIAFFPPVTGG
ncbi:MAG TPA: molybdopterin converting factor subunit 1 [Rhizomicrobium sp.]